MGNKENKDEYRNFGKQLCVLQRFITLYHSAWLRENGEYIYLKKDIIEQIKEMLKEEK